MDTENKAAIEINRNASNVSNLGQFMADLSTEKAYEIREYSLYFLQDDMV